MNDITGLNMDGLSPLEEDYACVSEELAALQEDYFKLVNLSIGLLQAVDSDDEDALEDAADDLYEFLYTAGDEEM
jgi:hypothetical protein